jgi:hypothetical protein
VTSGCGLVGSYKVVLRASGMAHGSFGDTVLSATTTTAGEQALHNLLLTTAVTRAFLDKFLTGSQDNLARWCGYFRDSHSEIWAMKKGTGHQGRS